MRIAVDIDHVLADLSVLVLPVLSEFLGRPISLADMTSFDVETALGVSPETAKSIWAEVASRNLYAKFPPVAGAVDVVNGWTKDDVWIVTSRNPSLRETTAEWLENNGISFDRLEFVEGLDKAQDGLHFDILIDDHPAVVGGASKNSKYVLILDYPWNQNLSLLPNCFRVYEWSGVQNMVESLRTEIE